MAAVSLFAPTPGQRLGIQPRDYQLKDHDESFRLWNAGERGVLTRSATGSGKTAIACLKADTWLSRGENQHVMVISYERQLVWQFAQEIEDFLGLTPGIEMASSSVDPDSMPKIVVASRQTLVPAKPPTKEQLATILSFGIQPDELGSANESHCNSICKALNRGDDVDFIRDQIAQLNRAPEANGKTWGRLFKFDWRLNWLLFFDEAHKHAYHLRTIRPIVDWFEQNPEHRRCGLTATPKRADGVSIGDKMFPAIALDYPLFSASTSKPCAVRDGWAVPYVQRYIEVAGVDFRDDRLRIGDDFDEEAIGAVLGEESTLAKITNPLLDMVGDRKTLIFSPTVDMSKNVARFINARSEVVCSACETRQWHPTLLIGDGAKCETKIGGNPAGCGKLLESDEITKSGEQARAIDGSIAEADRKLIYADHQANKFQFLSVCGLCIAKGSLVLTDAGEVPIENVTTKMKVWDGVEFVSHDGVIYKGIKPVIRYAGLTATEDHNVWTELGWKTLADCKKRNLPIAVSGIEGRPVFEFQNYCRTDNVLDNTTSTEEVYDILNAGPRHRFTANGLIVSNCREGYNDTEISCVAIFRPVSAKASSLAEQMKGRGCRPLRGLLTGLRTKEERLAAIANSEKPNCLIVDLVGVTGLADCASSVQIYAEGLADEIAEQHAELSPEEAAAVALEIEERAKEILAERANDAEPISVQDALMQAKKEDDDQREKVRKEREEAERRAAERAKKRSVANASVTYTEHAVGIGSQVDPDAATEAQYRYMGFLGMEVHTQFSRRKAGRIINMLKARTPLEEVARLNGLSADQWEKRVPSPKQLGFMRSRGIPTDKARTPYEASLLIDAKLNENKFLGDRLEAIGKARSNEELSAIGFDTRVAAGVVSIGTYEKIIAAGRAKRATFAQSNDTGNEPIPD